MRHTTTYRSVLARFAVLAALVGVGACDGHVAQLQPTEAETGSGLQTGHEALEDLAYHIPMPCQFERPKYEGFVYLNPDSVDIVQPDENTPHSRQIVDMWRFVSINHPLPPADLPDHIRWTCSEDLQEVHPTLPNPMDTPANLEGFALEFLPSRSQETIADWYLTHRMGLVTPGFETMSTDLLLMSADTPVPVAIAPLEVRYCEDPGDARRCASNPGSGT